MKKIIFVYVITSLFVLGCKDNTSKDKQHKNVETTTDITPQEEEGKLVPINRKRDLKEDRAIAELEIKNSSNDKKEPPFFLTTNYYVVDYTIGESRTPVDVLDKGEWYKFKKDKSYEHGFFDKVADEGKYKFDNSIVLLYPNDKSRFPSEWKIINSRDIIIMVGTSKFGNNATQKHTQNTKDKPQPKK